MSCDQRLCPVVGGRRCGAFMYPLFRDPHQTCDICKDWSVVQWEAFWKRLPYIERCTERPSGSTLPSAPSTLPPWLLQEPDALSLPLGRSPPPSEGRDRLEETEGVPSVGSREVLPPAVRWEGRGGAPRGLGFCGCEQFSCFLPSGGRGSGIIELTGVVCAR